MAAYKLTAQQRAMLRKVADADGWVLWQALGYPYQTLDALLTRGYVKGETWLQGYEVHITPLGRKALEEQA